MADSLDHIPPLPVTRRLLKPKVPGAMPPLSEQAQNALKAAARVGIAVVLGKAVKRSAEEQSRLMEICRGCEKWERTRERCQACGCVGRWKTALQTERCPLGKW